MPPSPRTLEIASALASGATIEDVVARYDIRPQRARHIRQLYAELAGQVGKPRSSTYTYQTQAGREWLARLVALAAERGWTPTELEAWIQAHLPRKPR